MSRLNVDEWFDWFNKKEQAMFDDNDGFEQDREFTLPVPTGKKFVSRRIKNISCDHKWLASQPIGKGRRFCKRCGATSIVENGKIVEYDATAGCKV